MSRWSFWDWVAYSLMFCTALIQAIEAAINSSASLRVTIGAYMPSGSFWGFVPLAFITTATLIF